MPLSTVSVVLRRNGLGRIGRIALEQPLRYERSRPGELVHIDIKKLGRIERGAGKRLARRQKAALQPAATPTPTASGEAEQAGSTSTSASTTTAASPTPRYSSTRKPPPRSASCNERSPSTASHGITVERVLTDNGSAYISTLHALACRTLGIRHLRTWPLPAPNKRQSRTLHPHHARRLGLRARSTARATSAPPPLTAGSGTTTIADDTQPLGHQPPVSRTNLLGSTSSASA